MGKILARGHSRVPVYSGNPKNIIGLLLVGVPLPPNSFVAFGLQGFISS